MTSFNAFTLSIAAIIMVITSIVGVVLLSTSVFKINSSLKKTVDVIEKYQRPFLIMEMSKNNLTIKNTGKTQAIIDSVMINNSKKLNELDNKSINPEQSFLIKNIYKNQEKISIEINYHSENKIYKESFLLR
ncbi:hypothetical protein [Companilactobacillus sp. HBUAS59699]|uniref:hypothetical protein n=1 Tax=Companilactobacillus sp. HBUAS59699 TaxID=3109358 RepID=UPI002FF1F852